ncbi:MAG: hypothetical protein ACPG7F_17070, partial [Aggregatilineales bacterium]
DGWVPLSSAESIAEVAENATLMMYENLGHALSTTEILAEDAFGVMDNAPITDIIAWIQSAS